MELNSNRKTILLTSFVLGIYTLLIVPIYSMFMNQHICEPSPFSCVNGVKFFGGESPLLIIVSLLIVPALTVHSGTKSIIVISIVNILLFLLDWSGMRYPPFLLPLSFKRTPSCYLFRDNCLDHNFFHLSHIPFYLVMIFFSYRAYRSIERSEQGL